MRVIIINSICGGILGWLLSTLPNPGWFIGMAATCAIIINSVID